MPVTKSAKKKLRQDKKRENLNNNFRNLLKKALSKAKKAPTPKNVSEAFRIIDRVIKKGIIHKNKGARLKSSLSKLVKPESKSKITTKSRTKKSTK